MMIWRQMTYVASGLSGQFVFTLQAIRALYLSKTTVTNAKTNHNLNVIRANYLTNSPEITTPKTNHNLNVIRTIYLTRTTQ